MRIPRSRPPAQLGRNPMKADEQRMAQSMREDWNERAHKDAFHYIASRRRGKFGADYYWSR